ncbi:TPA: hypothetical protein TZ824_000683 [Streptococcus suis]|nr:hypothetical protein [Streptococcus suis]
MKLARVRYNDINVPNIILINTEDENVNRKFILNLYIIKDNFQQRVFYNIKPSDFLKYFNNDNIEPGKSIEFTLPKKSPKANLELLNKYKITDINKDLNKT